MSCSPDYGYGSYDGGYGNGGRTGGPRGGGKGTNCLRTSPCTTCLRVHFFYFYFFH